MEYEWSSYKHVHLQNTNTHKMSTKTKQMVMTTMMQAFLCRPRVIHRNVRSQSWDVFRLNYVKGKCYTQHRHRHTHTQPPIRLRHSGMKICFSILFQFLLIFCLGVCFVFVCSTFTYFWIPNIFHCVPYFFPFVYIYICKHHHTHTHTDFAPFLLFTSSYFVPFHSHYMHFRKTITSLRYLKKHCLGSCIHRVTLHPKRKNIC